MKNKLAIVLILVLGFISCRKDDTTFDGPAIEDIFSTFQILNGFKADKDSVNFNTGETVAFSAQFSKIVKWQITITGTTSKAKKIINGESKSISSLNALWNGSTTNYPIFAKEICKVYLTLNEIPDTFKLNVKVINTKKVDGLLISGFESGLNPAWTKFIQSGANMDFKVKADTLAPEGKKYLNMAGTVNWDYLIGLIDFPATAFGASPTFALSTNPDAVYFNCLIYGTPNTNTSLVLFQFKEDENSNGTFLANSEDEYDYQVTVDWVGWKLVTIKYSDITSLVNGSPVTPKGNGLHNPDKLSKISMLHLADPNNGFASTKIDLIIFTENKPLEP